MTSSYTYLDLINICDNFHIPPTGHPHSTFESEHLTPFTLNPSPTSPILGLLRPSVVNELTHIISNSQDSLGKAWIIHETGHRQRISFSEGCNSPAARTDAMRTLCERWRDTCPSFQDVVGPKKWRGELYPVYRNPFGALDRPSLGGEVASLPDSDSEMNFVFEMERAACALFGVVTYGVHMTVYEDTGDEVKIWVPTRSKSKQTCVRLILFPLTLRSNLATTGSWPGYLDNTVAGGIPSGMHPFASIVKEAQEEASLPASLVEGAQGVGCISYYTRTKDGWLQPEIE